MSRGQNTVHSRLLLRLTADSVRVVKSSALEVIRVESILNVPEARRGRNVGRGNRRLNRNRRRGGGNSGSNGVGLHVVLGGGAGESVRHGSIRNSLRLREEVGIGKPIAIVGGVGLASGQSHRRLGELGDSLSGSRYERDRFGTQLSTATDDGFSSNGGSRQEGQNCRGLKDRLHGEGKELRWRTRGKQALR
jgi:hypothetical protein